MSQHLQNLVSAAATKVKLFIAAFQIRLLGLLLLQAFFAQSETITACHMDVGLETLYFLRDSVSKALPTSVFSRKQ
jgi:hypothetical protein